MKKRTPQPKRQGSGKMPFMCRLFDATRAAGFEIRGQTLEQAKETFIEHWSRAAWAALTIAQQGTHEMRELAKCAEWLSSCIEQQMWRKPEAGRYAFRAAQRMARNVAMMSNHNPPPAWLVELAPKEYEVPWLMVNGKPAPGFAEADAVLSWGRRIIKRGKNQFDAPQTRAVAKVVSSLSHLRAMDIQVFGKSELPPLSRKTKVEWWPKVKVLVKRNMDGDLSQSERRSIRATLDHDTESALMNEYLKRCKIAFDGLCPKD